MVKKLIGTAFLLCGVMGLSVNHAMAQNAEGDFLIRGVNIHTAAGPLIKDGAVGVKDGLITYVGKNSGVSDADYASVVAHKNAELYPGLIAMNTTIGLTEIFAVRATRDFNESGEMNPNVRSLIAYNAESDIGQTVFANGVLFAQVCPRGGVISGTSSVVKLQGWNWEDAVYKVDDGVHLTWPSTFKRKGERGQPRRYVANEEYEANLRELTTFFAQAKAYAKRKTPLERDLRMEGMRGVFSGEKRLYVKADFIKEIREAIAFKREMEIPAMTIIGGYDSWMAADLLRENNISVAVRRVNSLPQFAEDAVDAPYALAAKLAAANVLFCFDMDGGMETMQNRNLPFNIGTAIGFGLKPEDALKGATINAAKILGIADRTGSIEVGKEANFVISTGDIFDMRTSLIQEIYLQGKRYAPTTHQDALYGKYRKKYGLTED